jgi:hypothetical protein
MPRLQDIVTDQAKRKNLIEDCCKVLDQEVDSKGGLSGLAVKAAYKLVKGFKPGFVPGTVDSLLDDFCKQLQPFVDQAEEKKTSVSSHFGATRGPIADALLSITDERAKRSKHGTIKGTYERLRPTAKKHTEEAIPRVGTLIEQYTK